MSFESIELDFDDSEDKNSEENPDEKSISNDLISQGFKNHVTWTMSEFLYLE